MSSILSSRGLADAGRMSMFQPQMIRFILASIALLASGSFCPLVNSSEVNLNLSRSEKVKVQLEQNFLMNNKMSNRDWFRAVQSIIFVANPKRDGLSNKEVSSLSREVVLTAQCYGIDPGIYASLIWRESNFKPLASSDTGAGGLTQMTQSGVHEVLERLIPQSPRHLKHLRSLVKKCNPKIYDRIPGVISADVIAAWKNSAITSTTYSLVLGALLLKINLAHAHYNNKNAMRDLYRQALEKYNGDPKVKRRFALDVLQLERRLTVPTQFALSDSRFLVSAGRF